MKAIKLSKLAHDLSGKTYSRLTAVAPVGKANNGEIRWMCQCTCGATTEVSSGNLKSGCVRSCGCLRDETSAVIGAATRIHGLFGTPEYQVWSNMKGRCTNPNDASYHAYGGRGVKVCARWMGSVENFYADMGARPSADHSIDRIDNDGNYMPGNCRWATRREQSNNRRSSIFITYHGLRLTVAQWARRTGISHSAINHRINRGWSVEKSLGLINWRAK